MTISVDPDDYRSAGARVIGGAEQLVDALADLSEGLAGTWGMAGSDPSAASWSRSYDNAARELARATALMVSALGNVGVLLHQSGFSRAAAVSYSRPGITGPMPPAVDTYVPSPPGLVALPTAYGGGFAEPPGWWLVRDVSGYVWPDGHQDLLAIAGSTWDQLGDSVASVSTAVSTAFNELVNTNVAPEMGTIQARAHQIEGILDSIASASAKVGSAAGAYSYHLNSAHSRIIHEVEVLVATIAATQVAGWGLSVVTLGISEGASDVADAGLIAATAARVGEVLGDLADAVEGVLSTIEDAIDGIGGILGQVDDLTGLLPDVADFDQADSFLVDGTDLIVSPALESADLGELDAAADVVDDLAPDAVEDGGSTEALADSLDGDEAQEFQLGRIQKSLIGAASNATGSVVSDEIQGQPINPEELLAAAALGGAGGLVGATWMPKASGVANLGKNVAIDGLTGGSDEAADELLEGKRLDPARIGIAAGVSGVVGGGLDSGSDAIDAGTDGLSVKLGELPVHLIGPGEVIAGAVGAAPTTVATDKLTELAEHHDEHPL